MDNCTKFSDLSAHLYELFKSASYSESTTHRRSVKILLTIAKIL